MIGFPQSQGAHADPRQVLRQYWGFDAFRPPQDQIINAVLKGEDVLALLPTGGGKSICFQVPALCVNGLTVVISPLIALMHDQVDNLVSRGVNAASLTSGMDRRDMEVVLDNAEFGNLKLLYISPERLESEPFVMRLKQMPVSLIAVDESHCISQWGYDFRPPYLRISRLRDLFPKAPVIALTATATPRVVEDIQDKLAFRRRNVIQKSFARSNLAYQVHYESAKPSALLNLLKMNPGTAVVYTRNRRRTREIAEMLEREGISAGYYHAGLDKETRARRQHDWIRDKTRVIVATNAFGMGIDKPEVRLVVHMDIPDNLEAYFQEAGRAGRDGKPALAVALFSDGDRLQLKENFGKSFPEKAFIKRVYDALGNYLQVAVGFGQNEAYLFDLGDFTRKFKLPPLETLSALRILSAEGYLYLSDAVYEPPTVKVLLQGDHLYGFEVNNPTYTPLLQTLLRSYNNLFDQHVRIQISVLAKKANLTSDELIRRLETLTQMQVLEFKPASDAPRVTWIQPRHPGNRVVISQQGYDSRRKLAREQLDAVVEYMTSNKCRSIQLLAYFGEKDAPACGSCDVCTKANRKGKESQQHMRAILETLQAHHEMDIRSLIASVGVDAETGRKQVRTLFDEELVRFNERGNVCLTIKGAKKLLP
jgi:ATP-dependent DNA helicase RecQ